MNLSPLQIREVFHLEFLREFGRKFPPSSYFIKGGNNLRFYFGSMRYSEDLDVDVEGIPIERLRDRTLAILVSPLLLGRLGTFGIEEIVPPDLGHAKQTPTVQRFKVHLLTGAGDDLYTKIEFSRRGFSGPGRAEAVATEILRGYRLPPLIVPHYLAEAAIRQKIDALLNRRQTQARDVFDLFVLSTRIGEAEKKALASTPDRTMKDLADKVAGISLRQFREQAVSFLSPQDQMLYSTPEAWDEIRLVALSLLEGGESR